MLAVVMTANLISVSKFLSLVHRHKPDAIGLELDANGWVSIDELIRQARAHGRGLSREMLRPVVAQSDKQRFAIDAAGECIRAESRSYDSR